MTESKYTGIKIEKSIDRTMKYMMRGMAVFTGILFFPVLIILFVCWLVGCLLPENIGKWLDIEQ